MVGILLFKQVATGGATVCQSVQPARWPFSLACLSSWLSHGPSYITIYLPKLPKYNRNNE